jgi:hypothetical protein
MQKRKTLYLVEWNYLGGLRSSWTAASASWHASLLLLVTTGIETLSSCGSLSVRLLLLTLVVGLGASTSLLVATSLLLGSCLRSHHKSLAATAANQVLLTSLGGLLSLLNLQGLSLALLSDGVWTFSYGQSVSLGRTSLDSLLHGNLLDGRLVRAALSRHQRLSVLDSHNSVVKHCAVVIFAGS